MMNMMYSNKSLTKQLQENDQRFIIANEGFRNLGFASFAVNYKSLNKVKIKNCISPNFQGNGLGKSIINSVMEVAREHKNKTLSLHVNRDNKAVKFYDHIGFKQIENRSPQ